MHSVSLQTCWLYSYAQISNTKARPTIIKVGIEFDETGQAMRLRRDESHVEGTMPVLVT